MSKISDLADIDKPREKAERFGIDSLKDEELLALIITSGTVGHSALDIANEIMNECRYLSGLLNKPIQYFHAFKGMKRANALKLSAVIEIIKRINEKQLLVYEKESEVTSESLYRRYRLSIASEVQEVLAIVILNKNKQIVNEKVIYRGDDHSIAINYRDILRHIIINNGSYFYLIHNHPNGSLSPSEADIKFTLKMQEKASHINAKMLDHIIISKDGYYSFLHDRLLQEKNKLN